MQVKTVSYRAKNAPREFSQSLVQTGFAVLTEHPISPLLINQTYGEWETFFASGEKEQHRFSPELQAGYFPFKSENAKDCGFKDLKEFYHHYPDRKALPEAASKKTPELHASLLALGHELLDWIEQSMPSEIQARLKSRLSEMVRNSEETLLRVLHYPPLSGDEEPGAVRAAAHGDINLITLLPAATAPGLEVKDVHGNWHGVACDPGMIVINAGDMLEKATYGHYPSTIHRVVNPEGEQARRSRYSMPLFVHPRRSAQLVPGLTAGDYLDERLREIGLKPRG